MVIHADHLAAGGRPVELALRPGEVTVDDLIAVVAEAHEDLLIPGQVEHRAEEAERMVRVHARDGAARCPHLEHHLAADTCLPEGDAGPLDL